MLGGRSRRPRPLAGTPRRYRRRARLPTRREALPRTPRREAPIIRRGPLPRTPMARGVRLERALRPRRQVPQRVGARRPVRNSRPIGAVTMPGEQMMPPSVLTGSELSCKLIRLLRIPTTQPIGWPTATSSKGTTRLRFCASMTWRAATRPAIRLRRRSTDKGRLFSGSDRVLDRQRRRHSRG